MAKETDMSECEKCGREFNVLDSRCSEDVCPLALPGSGTNEREDGWAQPLPAPPEAEK